MSDPLTRNGICPSPSVRFNMGLFSAAIDQKAVCLFVRKTDLGGMQPFGSGCFFMRPDIVLTAKHVIADAENAEKGPVYVVNIGSGNGRVESVAPIEYWSHPQADIALVRLSKPGAGVRHPLYPSHFGLSVTEGLGAIGFSKRASDRTLGRWAVEVNHIDRFDVFERNRMDSDEFVIEFDAPWMEGGWSGGPLLGNGGGVVAVLTEVFCSQVDSTDALSPKTRGRATSVYLAVDAFASPFDRAGFRR